MFEFVDSDLYFVQDNNFINPLLQVGSGSGKSTGSSSLPLASILCIWSDFLCWALDRIAFRRYVNLKIDHTSISVFSSFVKIFLSIIFKLTKVLQNLQYLIHLSCRIFLIWILLKISVKSHSLDFNISWFYYKHFQGLLWFKKETTIKEKKSNNILKFFQEIFKLSE